jgi:hypothetical protein
MNTETTMEMKPNTYYSSASTLETYYVNQHGICFLIDAGECTWPDGHVESVDALPADAIETTAAEVALCDITLPDGIEEVTA